MNSKISRYVAHTLILIAVVFDTSFFIISSNQVDSEEYPSVIAICMLTGTKLARQ
jgi:hypothetical protein